MFSVGSLFSGIGGMDLGLERAGMTIAWQSEIDPYCNKVLRKHWPNMPNLGDIHKITDPPHVDLICGGFPCQPFSLNGKRKGEDDERNLWPEFARMVSAVRPRWVVAENVRGAISGVLPSIYSDLYSLGYWARAILLHASDFGADHERARLFVIGYKGAIFPDEYVWDGENVICPECKTDFAECWHAGIANWFSQAEDEVANSSRIRVEGLWSQGIEKPQALDRSLLSVRDSNGQWKVEPDICRVPNGVPNRVDRLKSLGNAVVPQVAEYIGRMVMAADIACAP